MVDPTVELTQPGGPYPYGDALLTDGAGGYTIAPTLRPYLLTFSIPGRLGHNEQRACLHQGVDSLVSGVVLTTAANLIGLAVSVDQPVHVGAYRVEALLLTDDGPRLLGAVDLDGGKRRNVEVGLNIPISAGSEVGVRVLQTAGNLDSPFSTGIVTVELEG